MQCFMLSFRRFLMCSNVGLNSQQVARMMLRSWRQLHIQRNIRCRSYYVDKSLLTTRDEAETNMNENLQKYLRSLVHFYYAYFSLLSVFPVCERLRCCCIPQAFVKETPAKRPNYQKSDSPGQHIQVTPRAWLSAKYYDIAVTVYVHRIVCAAIMEPTTAKTVQKRVVLDK